MVVTYSRFLTGPAPNSTQDVRGVVSSSPSPCLLLFKTCSQLPGCAVSSMFPPCLPHAQDVLNGLLQGAPPGSGNGGISKEQQTGNLEAESSSSSSSRDLRGDAKSALATKAGSQGLLALLANRRSQA
eukprot:1158140-Pelagomonas_calceolata.AAC.13